VTLERVVRFKELEVAELRGEAFTDRLERKSALRSRRSHCPGEKGSNWSGARLASRSSQHLSLASSGGDVLGGRRLLQSWPWLPSSGVGGGGGGG
jgi:hypothetical protein